MESAVLNTTLVDINAGEYTFKASGSTVDFPGFLKLFLDRKSKGISDITETLLPELEEGEQLKVKSLNPKQHFTQPPPRYTEASLVKALEELGKGRPSTYAPIIETIVSRGYVVREDKQFYPTELGTVVIDLLDDYFKDILNVEFTANLENKLDLVEAGELEWKDVISGFYQPFNQELERAEKEIGQIEVRDEVTDKLCDKCGRNMVIKYGRYGKFLACPGFPECRNAKPFLEEIGVSCPVCGGKIVQRRSKKGRKFYGCDRFPECDYISWNKPTNEVCPECGTRLVEKPGRNRKSKLVCPNDKCHFELLASHDDAEGKLTKQKEELH
jgi:DNA topoisomerase-1